MSLQEKHREVLSRFQATSVESVEIPSGASFWRFEVAGDRAFDAWRQLKDISTAPRYWPVIVGEQFQPPWGAPFFFDDDEDDRHPPSAAEILSAAEALPFDRWVARQRNPRYHAELWLRRAEKVAHIAGSDSYVEFCRKTANEYLTNPPRYKQASDYDWPDPAIATLTSVPKSALTFDDDYNYLPLDQCGIVLCQAEEPWQAPAHLLFTMNGEADDEVEEYSHHAAALRWFAEHFGVALIGVCDRTIDFLPARRPRNRIEAMELAVMVNSYANSPSGANVNADVPHFASYLLESPIWSFSWAD
jgi:hypothetical protein